MGIVGVNFAGIIAAEKEGVKTKKPARHNPAGFLKLKC